MKEIKTTEGTWLMKKPKAGPRNRCMEAAETGTGMRFVKFINSLLPFCIHTRPESLDKDVPIQDILDGMEQEDYDILIAEARKLNTTKADKETVAEKKESSVNSSIKASSPPVRTEDTSQIDSSLKTDIANMI